MGNTYQPQGKSAFRRSGARLPAEPKRPPAAGASASLPASSRASSGTQGDRELYFFVVQALARCLHGRAPCRAVFLHTAKNHARWDTTTLLRCFWLRRTALRESAYFWQRDERRAAVFPCGTRIVRCPSKSLNVGLSCTISPPGRPHDFRQSRAP